jgi:hypothetical protein
MALTGRAMISALFFLVPIAQPACSFAEVFELPRLVGEVEIDGRIDEDAWKRVTPLAVTQLKPLAGAGPTERTEIRIAYDDRYIYAAGNFYDSEADLVRGNSLQRDSSDGDDLFALVLDSLNDNESAMAFYTNPVGTRIDEAIANNAERTNGRPVNRSWNTFWDSAARRTDEGWFAEMRIPFSSLRFKNTDEKVVMGLIAWRYIARKAETASFPTIDPALNEGQIKPSVAADIVIRGVVTDAPLYVTPYILSGTQQRTQVNDTETAHRALENEIQEVGFDLKYALSSNLTLDVTWNTDFAQVEADNAQVNLSRFSLFQTEKRQFFQERSSLFDFKTGQQSRLFHSRRIGLGEDGEAVPIMGGVRLVGRLGNWDVGFLDMQTEGVDGHDDGFVATEGTPGENFGVLRLRRSVMNDRSFMGGMITSRLGDDGSSNLAYGIDSVLRFANNDEFTLRFAQTFDKDSETGERSAGIESGRFLAQYDRRTQEGLGFTFLGSWSGEDYDPGLGFASRTDFTRIHHEVRGSQLGDEDDSFRNRSWWTEGNSFWKNSAGYLESADWNAGINRQNGKGAWRWLMVRAVYENLEESFDLGETEVVAGEHSFFTIEGGANLPPGRDFRSGLNFRAGTFYDGTRWGVGVRPTWIISNHLQVGGNYNYDAIRFDSRGQSLDIHLLRFKVRYALDNHFSVDLFSQFSSQSGRLAHNLRLRYNFKEGHDIYLVYNEAQRTDRHLGELLLPETDSRTLLLKYSHAFSL